MQQFNVTPLEQPLYWPWARGEIGRGLLSAATFLKSIAFCFVRFWKKVYVKIVMQADNPCIQLFDTKDSKDAFQELPLQPAYSVSDISHQIFDQVTIKFLTCGLDYKT